MALCKYEGINRKLCENRCTNGWYKDSNSGRRMSLCVSEHCEFLCYSIILQEIMRIYINPEIYKCDQLFGSNVWM